MVTTIMWNSNCISCIGGKSVDIIELGTIPYSLYDDTVVHTPRDMVIPSTSMKLARIELPSSVNINGTIERNMSRSKTEPEKPSTSQDQFEYPEKNPSSEVRQTTSQRSEKIKISIDNFITEESESEENSICSLGIVSNSETNTDMTEENIVDYDADDEKEPPIDKCMVTKLPSDQELGLNESKRSMVDMTVREEKLRTKNITSIDLNNKQQINLSELDKFVDNVKEEKEIDEKETQLNTDVGLVLDVANSDILKDSEFVSKALDIKEHFLENQEIQASEMINNDPIYRLSVNNNSKKVEREIRTKSEDRERRRWRLEILQRSKSFTRKHMTSLTRNMDRNEELDLLKKHIRSKNRRIKPEAQKPYNDGPARSVSVDFSMFNVEQNHNLEPEELKQHNDESQSNVIVQKVEQKDEINSIKDVEKMAENENISEPHIQGKRKKKNNFLRSLVKLMDASKTKNKSFENKIETNSEMKQTDQDKMDTDVTILKDSQIVRGIPDTVDEHRLDPGTTMINVDEITEKTKIKKEMERKKNGSEKTNDKESRIVDGLKKIKWSDSIEKMEKKEKENHKVGKEMLSESKDEMKMVKKIQVFLPHCSERLEEKEKRKSKREFALRSVMNGKKWVVLERAEERQHSNHELKNDRLKTEVEKQSKKEKKSKKEMEKLLQKEEKLKKKRVKQIEKERKKLETKQNKTTEKIRKQNERELKKMRVKTEKISKKMEKGKEKERQNVDKNTLKIDKIDKKMEKMKEKRKQKMDSINKKIFEIERQRNLKNMGPEMKEEIELEEEIEREIEFCEREKEKMGKVKNWMNKTIFKKKRNNKVGVEVRHKKKIKPEFTRSELKFSPYQRQTPSPPRYKSLGAIRPPFVITPIGARKTLTALIEAANRKALSILQSKKFSMRH